MVQQIQQSLLFQNSGAANLTGSINSPVNFSLSEVVDKSDYKNTSKNTLNFTINPGGKISNITLFLHRIFQLAIREPEINTNDPDTPVVYAAVNGCGVMGPDISVSPGQFKKSLIPGGNSNDILNISIMEA